MAKAEKTNVMRVLDSKKVPYTPHTYEADPSLSGEDIAAILGETPDHVFKTLITAGKPGKYYVFIVPVNQELNLKKAASAAGEKSVHMILQKELLPLTGYVHGGCSPVGMKKALPTWMHESAQGYDRVYVSAGKVGWQVELAPADLQKVTGLQFIDLCS